MQTNKSPGADGFPVEFYRCFWSSLGQDLVELLNYSYEHGQLSDSQKQGIIRLLYKKDDLLLLKNWRPISLLNTDYKICTKVLANRLKKVLSVILSEDQTCGVPGRSIYENLFLLRDTAKSLIKKTLKDNRDPWLALLDQRNTPTESIGTSPAQRLMSRHTRTLLPTATNLLHPKVPESVIEKLKLKRQKAKWYHDRSSRILPEIEIGQDVRIAPLQKNQTWKTGTCIEKLSDRSYVVKTNSDNQVLRRNREFLKPAEQPAATTQRQTVVVMRVNPQNVMWRHRYLNKSRCLHCPHFQLSRRHAPKS